MPDGRVVVTAAGEQVSAWDCLTGRRLWQRDIDWGVNGMSLSPDGALLLVSDGSELAFINAADGELVASRAGEYTGAEFLADGSGILVGKGQEAGWPYVPTLLSSDAGEVLWSAGRDMQAEEAHLRGFAAVPQTSFILLVTQAHLVRKKEPGEVGDIHVRLYDWRAQEEIGTLLEVRDALFGGAAVSADGRILAVVVGHELVVLRLPQQEQKR